MKWANPAKLEIHGTVDAMGRIMRIVEKMNKHGSTGHGFDVSATDNSTIEIKLGYWDGDGCSDVTSIKMTEIPTGNTAEWKK